MGDTLAQVFIGSLLAFYSLLALTLLVWPTRPRPRAPVAISRLWAVLRALPRFRPVALLQEAKEHQGRGNS
jgi:hypothetical protein